jgi:hypothetical protein
VSQRLKLWIVVAVVVVTVVGCVGESESAAQAAGNPGHQDFSFGATLAKGPVGEPNQSKLWFNDGIWWGTLFDSTSGEFRVHRYDPATRTWTDDTGTLVDERNPLKADVLWDGAHLYAVRARPGWH